MDTAIRAVLDAYEARARQENERIAHLPFEQAYELRDELLICVGPDTGRLIEILARSLGAKSILELGTSYGYSTVWLAAAARATGGHVVSLELAPHKVVYAREQLVRAGLGDRVEFVVGDALDILRERVGPWDFVLIDLWKDLYVPCFDLIRPRLSPGAILVADNMLYPEAVRPQAEAYRAHVRASAGMRSVLVPVGSGIEISRFAGEWTPAGDKGDSKG